MSQGIFPPMYEFDRTVMYCVFWQLSICMTAIVLSFLYVLEKPHKLWSPLNKGGC